MRTPSTVAAIARLCSSSKPGMPSCTSLSGARLRMATPL
jgi:hypothetical protein